MIHIKKFLLSGSIIIVFIFYAVYQRSGNKSAIQPVVIPDSTGASQTTGSLNFKDGQFTGISANAYYGNIQVRAFIQTGKITDVQFLDYPKDRQTSIFINTQAMPILKSEAIQAQSSTVDIVSGATDTSYAFINSLASALSQALAPGQTLPATAPTPNSAPSIIFPPGRDN